MKKVNRRNLILPPLNSIQWIKSEGNSSKGYMISIAWQSNIGFRGGQMWTARWGFKWKERNNFLLSVLLNMIFFMAFSFGQYFLTVSDPWNGLLGNCNFLAIWISYNIRYTSSATLPMPRPSSSIPLRPTLRNVMWTYYISSRHTTCRFPKYKSFQLTHRSFMDLTRSKYSRESGSHL